MKLKSIAAFSIILMALVSAPQVASDLETFVASVAQSAHTAFLQAVIESRTGGNSKSADAAAPRESSTICLNRVPSKIAPRVKVRQMASLISVSRRVSNESVAKAAEVWPKFDPGIFNSAQNKAVIVANLPGMNARQLEELSSWIRKSSETSDQRRGLIKNECFQRLIKSVINDRNKSMRQLQRASAPVFKAAGLVAAPSTAMIPAVADAIENSDAEVISMPNRVVVDLSGE